jgi:hypothetical protein
VHLLRQTAGWVGLAGLLPLLYLYAVSGLVAPMWAVGALIAVWMAFLVVGLVQRRRRPLMVLALPAIGLALWFGVVSLGETLLGWTA